MTLLTHTPSRFVDCDMFMQYWGGGIGHKSIQKEFQKFCNDRWLEELNDIREFFTMIDGWQEQPADDSKEDTIAPKEGPIDPNCEDNEQVPEGGLESEAESAVSEDKGDEPRNVAASGVGSDDDLEYAEYWNVIAIYYNGLQ